MSETKPEEKVISGEICVVTSDGKEIKADYDTLKVSKVISEFYKDNAITEKIPLGNIKSTTFERVVEFYTYYKGKAIPKVEKPLKTGNLTDVIKDPWLAKFLSIPTQDLNEMLTACNFLGLEDMMQLGACSLATRFVGKSVEELRKEFVTDPELTPAQDKELQQFFGWADQLWPKLPPAS